MRVLFLDIDGVQNSRNEWVIGMSCTEQPMNPRMVARLQKIISATDAKIVISSTWRRSLSVREIKDLLVVGGLDPNVGVIDCTPTSHSGYRGLEIDEWLQHAWKFEDPTWSVSSYVILDDGLNMRPHTQRLVQTTWEDGLQDHHVELAIQHLETPVTEFERERIEVDRYNLKRSNDRL